MNFYWIQEDFVDERNNREELVDSIDYYLYCDKEISSSDDNVIVFEYSNRYGVFTRIEITKYKHFERFDHKKINNLEFKFEILFHDLLENKIETLEV